jgi:glutamate dehydrogenase
VGDRANDAVRVNGGELRCKVLGEGGNLGAPSSAASSSRSAGGRINTDAIDNSAGVDCSDHEVNIKILLGGVVAEGELTLKQRNELLADMTDEVGRLVLRDNYRADRTLFCHPEGRQPAAQHRAGIHHVFELLAAVLLSPRPPMWA